MGCLGFFESALLFFFVVLLVQEVEPQELLLLFLLFDDLSEQPQWCSSVQEQENEPQEPLFSVVSS